MNGKDDFYIEVFEVSVSGTNFGPEEITRDILNLWEEDLKNLEPDGVIRVKTNVKPGDILVGKLTPLGMRELAQEERLLKAIFGDKVMEFKDTSFRAPPGTYGLVTDVKVSAKTCSLADHRKQLAGTITSAKVNIASLEGDRYYFGRGVSKDHAEAANRFRRAAERGLAEAQNRLGICFLTGHGVARDYAEAVKWFRKAAEQGDPSAQNNLGVAFFRGFGVPEDYAAAVAWYRNAAEQGNVEAQNNLGSCYELGLGVSQNDVEAVAWFRKAAEQGDAEAQYDLGFRYKVGEGGVVRDEPEARTWFHRAEKRGFKGRPWGSVRTVALLSPEQFRAETINVLA